jgi:hypothetical protein
MDFKRLILQADKQYIVVAVGGLDEPAEFVALSLP